jgi:hypothetical protein
MNENALRYEQVQVAVAAAKRRYDRLRQKYPDLDQKEYPAWKAYLVLSSPAGQVSVDASPREMLLKFPAVVLIDASIKTKALALVRRLKALEEDSEAGPEIKQLMKQWDQVAPQLRYDENCRVEIRFHNLNYETIEKLQVNELVDRTLTPQTKASIRIVLGSLAHFERMERPRACSVTARTPYDGNTLPTAGKTREDRS